MHVRTGHAYKGTEILAKFSVLYELGKIIINQ